MDYIILPSLCLFSVGFILQDRPFKRAETGISRVVSRKSLNLDDPLSPSVLTFHSHTI